MGFLEFEVATTFQMTEVRSTFSKPSLQFGKVKRKVRVNVLKSLLEKVWKITQRLVHHANMDEVESYFESPGIIKVIYLEFAVRRNTGKQLSTPLIFLAVGIDIQ